MTYMKSGQSFYSNLLRKYPIITDQIDERELTVILRELEKVLLSGIDGDIVEFGCYQGTTSLFLQRMIHTMAPHKKLWVYDSFEGLPPKEDIDSSTTGTGFVEGALKSTKNQLIMNFKKANLASPIITKGWFVDVSAERIPITISLAFLDGDYYGSILESIKLVWPRMQKGGIILIDDYQNEALPGASKAVEQWAREHNAKFSVEASLAIFRF